MAKLIILTGVKSGLSIDLRSSETVIGRDPSCDVVIAADWISRRHCRVIADGDRWVLEDLGSTNGVRVNNLPVEEPVVLMPGDLISIGALEFAFDAGVVRRGDVAASDEVQRLASDTQVVAEPAWGQAAPDVAYLDVGARDVPIIRPPELHFHVAVAARLMSLDEVTLSGKTDLRKLARQGMLAADTPFPGRYAGKFKRVRFITLDSYGLVGRAGYTLHTGLSLPIERSDGSEDEAETDVEYRTEYSLAIPRRQGPGVLSGSAGEPTIQPTSCTVSVAEGMVDSDATRYLLTETAGSARAGPYNVAYDNLVGGLEHLCWKSAGEVDLEDMLRKLALDAADAYRKWYSERWREKALWHDSQLPVGELRYRFDRHGNQLERPKAIAVTSVTRWL